MTPTAVEPLLEWRHDIQEPSPRDEVRAEIREFLTTRRAKITPEQAGLPTYGGDRRRVPGLRARRPHSSSGSRRSTTSASNAATPPASPRASSTASPTRSSSTRPNAPTCSTCSAPPAHPDPTGVADGRRLPSRSGPPSSGWSTAMHDVPAVVMNGRLDVLATNALGRALFAPVRTPTGRARRTTPGSSSSTRAPRRSSASGRPSPTTPSPCCAPRPAATPTTGSSPTSSASSPPAARTSASAGQPTTSASTAPASSCSTIPSSAT